MKQPRQTRCFKEALARVQHLFVDAPGVQLTPADAAQMAGLDRQVCRVVLRTLTESGVLEQGMRGVFVHRSSDSVPVEDGKWLKGQARVPQPRSPKSSLRSHHER
jgi:hypothetical protein